MATPPTGTTAPSPSSSRRFPRKRSRSYGETIQFFALKTAFTVRTLVTIVVAAIPGHSRRILPVYRSPVQEAFGPRRGGLLWLAAAAGRTTCKITDFEMHST
ncbi:hypothetical protein RB195_005126 [Necator americanus]|uniref:Uncharacterized protein n=1 Tax=Necator americanus TaxID=51031 RepID=A0ABR1BPJ6_NECAM